MGNSHGYRGVSAWTLGIAVVAVLLAIPAAKAASTADRTDIEAAQKDLAELGKQDISPLFRAVARIVRPAVVEVTVTKFIKEPDLRPEMDEMFRRFFGGNDNQFGPVIPRQGPRGRSLAPQLRQRQVRGLGSGMVIDAQEGYILTNYHVVAGADEVVVGLSDGRKFSKEWIRSDPQSDLAIIKIKADGLVVAKLGDSSNVEVGDLVLAIGAPRGQAESVTAGIISGKGRNTGRANNSPSNIQLYQDYFQTDAAINPGNSGGPLVNMKAEVIGINNSIMTSSGGNEGIGFAVPSNMVKNILIQLVEKGKVIRGFLGVKIKDIDNPGLADSYGLPDSKGALVVDVSSDSPAAAAGIQAEDVIVAVDGKSVANANELRNEVAKIDPGKTVPVKVYRSGKEKTIDVKIAAQPKEMTENSAESGEPEEAATNRFGLKVATLTADMAEELGYKNPVKGVAITAVEPGSDAEKQDLRPGIVITKVDGKEVATVEEFNRLIAAPEAAKGVRLLVTAPSGGWNVVFIEPTKPRGEKTK